MQPTPVELLLATTNAGKRREFAQLLPANVILRTLDEAGVVLPPEDGATFAANADAKATAASRQSGLVALADDSGLEVAALDGAPGVRSARFAGEPRSDQRNRTALLDALQRVPPGSRAARFVCAVSVAKAGAVVARSEGICEGAVAEKPIGEHGFGYDPIFLLPDGRTMAELSPAEKNSISHRAVAYWRVLPALLAALTTDAPLGASQ
jgi:XTP/dITP diphosphohydrolase